MNNRIKSLFCLILVLCSILCLTACGSSESTPSAPAIKQSVTGRYELQSITYTDGTSISGDLLEETLALMGDTFLELYEDQSALLCLYGVRTDMEFSDSEIWNAISPMMRYPLSVRNGTATLDYTGTIFTFVKK